MQNHNAKCPVSSPTSHLSLCARLHTEALKFIQAQVHSAKTHQRALLSASTNPLQTPLSPHLIIVSQTPPSPLSFEPPVPMAPPRSSFLISLNIFPPGDWIAS